MLYAIVYNIPLLSNLFVIIITIIVKSIIFICDYFNILPLSKISVYPLGMLEIVIYSCVIYTIFFSKNYYYKLNNIIKSIISYVKEMSVKNKVIICITSDIIIIISMQYNYMKLEINFIDVGQGDCTFIQTQGKNILIDGGGSNDEYFDVGERVLKPYLLHERASTIDYMFISHFDSDHYKGLISIIEEFKVKNIVVSIQYIQSKEFEEFIQIANEKRINIIVVKTGDKICINDKVFFYIIFPDNIFEVNSINNNSVVMMFNYYNFTMLFTGDIEKEAENYLSTHYINNLKANVLKVAHHGSSTSSQQEFIESVNPNIALIGVGRDNKFGHPNKEVIQRLNENGINIFRTDLHGQINISKFRYGKIHISTML